MSKRRLDDAYMKLTKPLNIDGWYEVRINGEYLQGWEHRYNYVCFNNEFLQLYSPTKLQVLLLNNEWKHTAKKFANFFAFYLFLEEKGDAEVKDDSTSLNKIKDCDFLWRMTLSLNIFRENIKSIEINESSIIIKTNSDLTIKLNDSFGKNMLRVNPEILNHLVTKTLKK